MSVADDCSSLAACLSVVRSQLVPHPGSSLHPPADEPPPKRSKVDAEVAAILQEAQQAAAAVRQAGIAEADASAAASEAELAKVSAKQLAMQQTHAQEMRQLEERQCLLRQQMQHKQAVAAQLRRHA